MLKKENREKRKRKKIRMKEKDWERKLIFFSLVWLTIWERKIEEEFFNVMNYIKLLIIDFYKIEEFFFLYKIEYQLIIFIHQRMKQKLLSKEYQHTF